MANELYGEVIQGDCALVLPELKAQSVQCCVTSPPYWGLRDYGTNGQLGLEATPEEYISKMVAIFGEIRRILRDDGTLWLNLGDSYAGGGMGGGAKESSTLVGTHHDEREGCRFVSIKQDFKGLKPKNIVGIPWRVAFALQADGWYLRSDIIWHKPNPMPESVTDRPTKAHEYIFLLTKQERYFYDAEAIREKSPRAGEFVKNNGNDGIDAGYDGHRTREGFRRGVIVPDYRNKRSVWTIGTQPYSEAHFATFPEEIPKLCILAGTSFGDTVLDPFAGSGTTGRVALELGRKAILIELNPKYCALARQRCDVTPAML